MGSGGTLEAIWGLENIKIAKKGEPASVCQNPPLPRGLHFGAILGVFFVVVFGSVPEGPILIAFWLQIDARSLQK